MPRNQMTPSEITLEINKVIQHNLEMQKRKKEHEKNIKILNQFTKQLSTEHALYDFK